MRLPRFATLMFAATLSAATACHARAPRSNETPEPKAPSMAMYTGEGAPTSVADFVATLEDVDFIGFGELHRDPVGSSAQLEILTALAGHDRPIVLAMEFFEAQTQTDLDAYLAGEIDEATFRERTERDEAYEHSHRPLIEFCKARGIRVIAANAPHDLVTAYRKSPLDYASWLETLGDEDLAMLPEESVPPDDEFKRRFMQTMGADRGQRFYKSMALWNDAMAEAAARYRDEHQDARVMLIVGTFHVAADLGTVTQYLRRRPDDSVRVLTMVKASGERASLAFTEDDRGEGDVILKVP